MPSNPLASASMGSASGDLGLSQQALDEAQDMANKMKKKKAEDQKLINTSGVASSPTNAFSSLMGGTV